MHIDIKDNNQDPNAPLQLLQLTDTHLGATPSERLLGMDTDASLNHVLELVRRQHHTADLLLATGDLSNNGAVAAYQRFHQLSQGLARHSLWLPGNHDKPAAMQAVIGAGPEMARYADAGNWRIIMLDSTVRRQVGGHLAEAELTALRDALASSPERHVLVCLHHPPLSIGCAWLDEQQVANGADFFAVLDQFAQVRGVLWGHIHQQFERERKGVKLMATPSTCVQFAPNSAGFKLDRQSPGYRWLQLHADGRIESTVSRVSGVAFDIDYNRATGY